MWHDKYNVAQYKTLCNTIKYRGTKIIICNTI